MASNDRLLSFPIVFVLIILVVVAGFNFYTSRTTKAVSKEEVIEIVNNYLENNPDKIILSSLEQKIESFLTENADDITEQAATKSQEKKMELHFAEFLLKNPQVILESVNQWQRDQAILQQKKAQEKLTEKTDILHNNPDTPYAGNPNGDVMIAEFYDYNCGYCKKAMPTIDQLLKEDSNIKISFIEFPILSPNSQLIAKYALAVHRLDADKFYAFHKQLMESRGSKSEESLIEMVTNMGLDGSKAKEIANGEEIQQYLQASNKLGREIGVNGTPAFVIGNRLIPGAVSYEDLRKIVNEVREKKVKKEEAPSENKKEELSE